VIHADIDFYENDLGDVLVSNPPYSQGKRVIARLAQLDKPFIMIMPSSKINTQYFREHFKGKGVQIIVPPRRIQFTKLVSGAVPSNYKSRANFDTFYYCYKIGLERDIMWL
jgi:hypothetical protein